MDEPGESSRESGLGPVALRSAADDLIAVIQDLSMTRTLASVQEIVRRAARRLMGAAGATFVLREGEQCFYADEDAVELICPPRIRIHPQRSDPGQQHRYRPIGSPRCTG